ncbi:winged helix-turn-helix transcriptional regulator [Sinomonas atrocyanea]|uniref:winged helix-turn-helix transcriptional regulator n=1 Tax=Sinomonas atrocyanea TaxID=37927 RepID=UPI001C3F96DE|nr:helix-turn-helix domain-containing protein [Sinomonas atrocyanea]
MLGDPWTLLVLRELVYGVHRFEDIRANIESTDKTLSERLERMIDAGLVSRRQYSGTVRPRYEYLPTSAGRDALPILQSLAFWGAKHTEARDLDQPFAIVCLACGQETHRSETCSSCGAELTTGNTIWIRPTTRTGS